MRNKGVIKNASVCTDRVFVPGFAHAEAPEKCAMKMKEEKKMIGLLK